MIPVKTIVFCLSHNMAVKLMNFYHSIEDNISLILPLKKILGRSVERIHVELVQPFLKNHGSSKSCQVTQSGAVENDVVRYAVIGK